MWACSYCKKKFESSFPGDALKHCTMHFGIYAMPIEINTSKVAEMKYS